MVEPVLSKNQCYSWSVSRYVQLNVVVENHRSYEFNSEYREHIY